jgi:hypothetical protein
VNCSSWLTRTGISVQNPAAKDLDCYTGIEELTPYQSQRPNPLLFTDPYPLSIPSMPREDSLSEHFRTQESLRPVIGSLGISLRYPATTKSFNEWGLYCLSRVYSRMRNRRSNRSSRRADSRARRALCPQLTRTSQTSPHASTNPPKRTSANLTEGVFILCVDRGNDPNVQIFFQGAAKVQSIENWCFNEKTT